MKCWANIKEIREKRICNIQDRAHKYNKIKEKKKKSNQISKIKQIKNKQKIKSKINLKRTNNNSSSNIAKCMFLNIHIFFPIFTPIYLYLKIYYIF